LHSRATVSGERPRGTPRTIHWVALAVALSTVPVSPSPAAAATSGRVQGVVLDHATKAPVAGALVVLPSYGVSVSSGGDGSFAFADPLPTDSPYRRIRAVVTAPGFGRWTIRGVPFYPDDTLKLRAELRPHDWEHQVLAPAERAGRPRTQAPNLEQSNTCTGWDYVLVPPETIKVFLSEEGVSEEYDFFFYATHVLPSEWFASWDEDSIGAGAIPVKTYAWYRTMPGNAYSGGQDCADVIDTVADQVFDPTYSHERTDQAVYATMGSILLKHGDIFLSQYWSGAEGDPCEPVEDGQFAGRMSQWGTLTCAEEGEYWPDITTIFYQEASWKHLENLMLNHSVESKATYPWTWTGEASRVEGNAYAGKWHWRMEPPRGKTGAIRERLPYLGTNDTDYHSEVALRCQTENPTDCTITIKIEVYESDGTSHKKSKTLTQNDDGKWRVHSFDPSAFADDHAEVKLVVSSKQTFAVDTAVLWAPYGGP
jgi:hypothetical protein